MRGIVASGLGLLALWLAGCGFQLRGPVEWPPPLRVLYIQTQTGVGLPPGAVSRRLPMVLADSGITVTRDPTQASAILTLLHDESGRRVVAADPQDIKREYYLVFSIGYQLTLPDGKVLIPAESLNVQRELLFDENRVLGFEAAQDTLIDNMADDLAWQLVRRLQALKL